MTHDRGGPAVIGVAASVVLVSDIACTESRWGGSFSRSFLLTLLGMGMWTAVAMGLRVYRPIGTSRRASRWRRRAVRVAFLVSIVLFLDVSDRIGGDVAGEIAGAVAGLSGVFTLVVVVDLVRRRMRASRQL
jgi:hypothetical protein